MTRKIWKFLFYVLKWANYFGQMGIELLQFSLKLQKLLKLVNVKHLPHKEFLL